MAKGIKKANDPRRKNWDWSQDDDWPTLKTRYELARQVNEWLGQWNRWFNTVLLRELDQAVNDDDKDEQKFHNAMKAIQSAGHDMNTAGCNFLNNLYEVYPDPPRGEASDSGGRPPRGDATKPPPPPFGGGH